MSRLFARAYCSIVLSIALPFFAHAAEMEADPAQANIVLRALMSVSNTVIPSTSSCSGNYGQRGRATVKDVLSMQFAHLYRGDNKVLASCVGKYCNLQIRHADGESVFSADISFELSNGKARISTLQCVLTP